MSRFCSAGTHVWLDATLSNFWLLVAWGLIVLITASAVLSSWISPVAAGLTPAERQKQGYLARFWFFAISALSVMALLVALVLAVQPVGCARHAFLVSAYVPLDAADWQAEEASFRNQIQTQATREGRLLEDLAPMRDQILKAFAGSTVTESQAARLPELVGLALADFTRGVLPPSSGEAPNRLIRGLDPAFIETVEFAVLQAWRAFNRGGNQRMSYLVSDRAAEYDWDWERLAAARLGGAAIRSVRARGNTPEISRVISVRRSDDGQRLDTLIVFSLPTAVTSSLGMEVPLRLVDREGQVLAEARAILAKGPAGVRLAEVAFAKVTAELGAATRVVQPSADGLAREAAVPPVRPSPIRVAVEASGNQKNNIEHTLRFLANPGHGCTARDEPLRRRAAIWPQSFAADSDGRPVIAARADDSDVVLRATHDGVLLVVPVPVEVPIRAPYPPAGDRFATSDDFGDWMRRQMEVKTPELSPDLFVLWDLSSAPQMFSVNRLGVSGGAAGKLRVLPGEGGAGIPRDRLFVTAEHRRELGQHRLGLDAYATFAGQLERRWDAQDRPIRGAVLSATALGIDLQGLEVLCGTAVPDADLFFGIWRLIFERMLAAVTPRVVFALPTTVSEGAPRMVFSQADLQEITLRRLENSVLTVLGVLTFHLLVIAWAYRMSGRLQRLD